MQMILINVTNNWRFLQLHFVYIIFDLFKNIFWSSWEKKTLLLILQDEPIAKYDSRKYLYYFC